MKRRLLDALAISLLSLLLLVIPGISQEPVDDHGDDPDALVATFITADNFQLDGEIEVAGDRDCFTFEADSDNTYSLTGGGDNVKVMSMLNDTQNCFMEYQTKDWFNDALYIANASEGAPKYFTYNGLDGNGDTQILVGPTPDGVYSIRVDLVKRQADLSANDDSLLIPSQPVIHLAVALLARERGETGGTSTAEYFQIANQYLSDAIAIDAAKHPEEMVFRTV